MMVDSTVIRIIKHGLMDPTEFDWLDLINPSLLYQTLANRSPGLWKIHGPNDGNTWDYLPNASNITARLTTTNYSSGSFTQNVVNGGISFLYYGLDVKQFDDWCLVCVLVSNPFPKGPALEIAKKRPFWRVYHYFLKNNIKICKNIKYSKTKFEKKL